MLKIQCPDAEFDNIRAIFFDKDGTLVQVAAYLELFTETLILQLEQCVAGIAVPLRASLGLTARGLDPNGLMATAPRTVCIRTIVDILVERGMLRSQAEPLVENVHIVAEQSLPRKAPLTPLVPGILNLLRSLERLPVQIGILTADSPAHLQDCLNYYDLRSSMHLTLGSEPGRLSKPALAFYQAACAQLGCPPEQTIMIGDAESDCRMAKSAGATAIGVTWAWSDISPQFQSADAILIRVSDFQVLATEPQIS